MTGEPQREAASQARGPRHAGSQVEGVGHLSGGFFLRGLPNASACKALSAIRLRLIMPCSESMPMNTFSENFQVKVN